MPAPRKASPQILRRLSRLKPTNQEFVLRRLNLVLPPDSEFGASEGRERAPYSSPFGSPGQANPIALGGRYASPEVLRRLSVLKPANQEFVLKRLGLVRPPLGHFVRMEEGGAVSPLLADPDVGAAALPPQAVAPAGFVPDPNPGAEAGQASPPPAATGSIPPQPGPTPAPPAAPGQAPPASDSELDFPGIVRRMKGLGFEGQTHFMYGDSNGKPTVGIGTTNTRQTDKDSVPLYTKDGVRATQDQVNAEAARIRKCYQDYMAAHPDAKSGPAANYYRDATDLRTRPEDEEAAAAEHLRGDDQFLRDNYPGYDKAPLPAKHALLDMTYTLGRQGIVEKYPKLGQAVADGRWHDAALESGRNSKAPNKGLSARNAWTRAQFEQAASNPWP